MINFPTQLRPVKRPLNFQCFYDPSPSPPLVLLRRSCNHQAPLCVHLAVSSPRWSTQFLSSMTRPALPGKSLGSGSEDHISHCGEETRSQFEAVVVFIIFLFLFLFVIILIFIDILIKLFNLNRRIIVFLLPSLMHHPRSRYLRLSKNVVNQSVPIIPQLGHSCKNLAHAWVAKKDALLQERASAVVRGEFLQDIPEILQQKFRRHDLVGECGLFLKRFVLVMEPPEAVPRGLDRFIFVLENTEPVEVFERKWDAFVEPVDPRDPLVLVLDDLGGEVVDWPDVLGEHVAAGADVLDSGVSFARMVEDVVNDVFAVEFTAGDGGQVAVSPGLHGGEGFQDVFDDNFGGFGVEEGVGFGVQGAFCEA